MSEQKGKGLPSVGGERLESTLADHARACQVLLANEQEKLNPDTALIAVLCGGVRLTREMTLLMRGSRPQTKDEIIEAIQTYFGDTSRPATETLQDLQEIASEIDTSVRAIEDDLRRAEIEP